MDKKLIDSLIDRIDQLEKKISILKDSPMASSIENKVIEYSTKIEISPCLGEMNWEKAINACEELGEGWRLPTLLELYIMYLQKSKDDRVNYWSSTQFNAPNWSSSELFTANAFLFSFANGYAHYTSKNNSLSVRGVRDI